jgi:hypothetical protein
MGQLITEFTDFASFQFLKEDTVVDGEKRKNYFLVGPVLEAEALNRNKRRYPFEVLNREVKKYINEKINTKRSLGELDHPPEPTLNLARASHLFTELYMDGNVGMAKARLLDTPMGKIAKTLVDEGIVLGMSTRGVGSINGEYVGDDYNLITPGDIVADPSCQKAFVEGVLEGKHWELDGDRYVEIAVQNFRQKAAKQFDKFGQSKLALQYLNEFIEEISMRKI